MKTKRLLRILFCLLLTGAAVVLIGILMSFRLTATEYTVRLDDIREDITIVLLSDLHSRRFGNDNGKLLTAVREQSPDIIALTGDIIDRDDTAAAIAETAEFAGVLAGIAPVYYSLGNHEQDYIAQNGDDFLQLFSDAGVTILNDAYLDLEINGSKIRLGGMDRMAYTGGNGVFDHEARAFLMDYMSTNLPTILLSHRPEFFSFLSACKEWDIDLILSGHTHGGLIRLPFVGGLYAPIQGWFPKTDYGKYTFFGTRMIVTSGLAAYDRLPRVFNPQEICVVIITKAN